MSGYFFKQVVGALAAPLMLTVILAAAGLALRLACAERLVSWMLAVAAGTACLGSMPAFGDVLLGPFPRRRGSG